MLFRPSRRVSFEERRKTDDGNADGHDALGRKFHRAFFFVDDVRERSSPRKNDIAMDASVSESTLTEISSSGGANQMRKMSCTQGEEEEEKKKKRRPAE